MPSSSKATQTVNIVGAGVFGLSSALHLALDGFQVTLFDRNDLRATQYSSVINDGASCDMNKIVRTAYGGDTLIQSWANESLREWQKWDEERRKAGSQEPLLDLCGYARLDNAPQHRSYEAGHLAYCDANGTRHTQYDLTLDEDQRRAARDGWAAKMNAFTRPKGTIGVLDSTAGVVRAADACHYLARRLADELGVRFVTGETQGRFSHWYDGNSTSFVTADGRTHHADRVVMALGPWSAEHVPELRPSLEATAGSVMIFEIDAERTDLLARHDAAHMPILHIKPGHDIEVEPDGGVYAFPHQGGLLKIGSRGVRYTNPSHDSLPYSRPITSVTSPSLAAVPRPAAIGVARFIANHFPHLVEPDESKGNALPIKLVRTRLCWYTDTYDKNFFICELPFRPGVVLCTGGSGHGFKFLPVLGQVTLDVIKGRQTALTDRFRWRTRPQQAREAVTAHSSLLYDHDLVAAANVPAERLFQAAVLPAEVQARL